MPGDRDPKKPRSFTFRISLGTRPTPEALPPDAERHESERSYEWTLNPGDEAPAEEDRRSENELQWERLANLGHAYPDTARIHRVLGIITTVLAVAVPLTVLVLTLATGQNSETVFFMTLGAAIVAGLMKSSLP